MRTISKRVKDQILEDPFYCRCAREALLKDHVCAGRITWEHSFIYGGKQIDEVWAIIPLCAFAHGVDQYQDCGIMDKKISEWIAINRMTAEDEAKYPKRNWAREREWLNKKYGVPRIFIGGAFRPVIR